MKFTRKRKEKRNIECASMAVVHGTCQITSTKSLIPQIIFVFRLVGCLCDSFSVAAFFGSVRFVYFLLFFLILRIGCRYPCVDLLSASFGQATAHR